MIDVHSDAAKILDEMYIASDDWEQAPMLFCVSEIDGEVSRAAAAMADGIHPGDFLELFSDQIIEIFELNSNLVGVYLYSEGFGLPHPTPEEIKAGKISENPRRIECRIMLSYDGETFKTRIHNRGTEGWTEMDSGEGRLPDVLKTFYLKAITA